MSATQSVNSRQKGVKRCQGNALRMLIPILATVVVVLTGTTAHADTTPPITVTGGTPVITNPPITVKSGKPVVKAPKPHKHRAVAIARTSPRAVLPPVLSYYVKANLWQHTAANDSATTRIQLIPGGSLVQITCWTTGTSESGDSVWYKVPFDGHGGYVSGFYVATGHDPASGVGHC